MNIGMAFWLIFNRCNFIMVTLNVELYQFLTSWLIFSTLHYSTEGQILHFLHIPPLHKIPVDIQFWFTTDFGQYVHGVFKWVTDMAKLKDAMFLKFVHFGLTSAYNSMESKPVLEDSPSVTLSEKKVQLLFQALFSTPVWLQTMWHCWCTWAP